MAFDGTYLYYTIVGDTNIYKITTAGVHVATIPIAGGVSAGGPLAWDGSALWTIYYFANSFDLLRVNPADGSIMFSCNIAAVNPAHPAVTSSPNIGNVPDGMDWTGSQLVLSSEIFPTPNWVVFLNTDCTITSAFNPHIKAGFGASGVAFDGVHLWHSNAYFLQYQTDVTGVQTGASFANTIQLEDLAYDPITFAPACVIWGNEATSGPNRIQAYEVPCGTPTPVPPPLGGVANYPDVASGAGGGLWIALGVGVIGMLTLGAGRLGLRRRG